MTIIGPNEVLCRVDKITRGVTEGTVSVTTSGVPVQARFVLSM